MADQDQDLPNAHIVQLAGAGERPHMLANTKRIPYLPQLFWDGLVYVASLCSAQVFFAFYVRMCSPRLRVQLRSEHISQLLKYSSHPLITSLISTAPDYMISTSDAEFT